MAEFEMIRPINLPQAQELADNDVFVIDSETGGVRKIPQSALPSKEELLDIRVGANGETYPSAGDAVRGQVADLKSEISDLPYIELFDKSAVYAGREIADNGGESISAGYNISDYIPFDTSVITFFFIKHQPRLEIFKRIERIINCCQHEIIIRC